MAGQNLRPVALAISFGRTDSVKNSGGVLWNCFAEAAPKDAKNPITLVGSPGQIAFAALGTTAARVCHAIELGIYVYAVTTRGLYRITSNGSVTQLATFTVGPLARMATNGFDIVIVDGVKALAYNTEAPGPVTEMVHEFFPAASVAAIDGYFVFEAIGTGQFFHTELNSIEIDSLSLSTAEAYPDHALGVFAHRRQLWVFGQESIEHFYNFGGTASAFARVDGSAIPHGIAGTYAVAANEHGLAYLSADGVFNIATGLVPQQVSTAAIHDAIEGLDFGTATVFAYTQNGHALFQLNVGTKSFCYDMSTGLWHGLRDETYGRHRASFVLNAFSKLLMGDAATNQVRELSMNAATNVGETLVLDIITPAIHADQRANTHAVFELELDTGEGGAASSSLGDVDLFDADAFDLTDLAGNELQGTGTVESFPLVSLSYSDNDGNTWSEPVEQSLGYAGEWVKRIQWRRLGSSRNRRYRIQILSPIRRSLVGRAWLLVK